VIQGRQPKLHTRKRDDVKVSHKNSPVLMIVDDRPGKKANHFLRRGFVAIGGLIKEKKNDENGDNL
jgi:hypothetical protein